MPLPDALAGLAPEANLHSVVIARRERRSDARGPQDADDVFFAKGNASAAGFRPSYWEYDGPEESRPARNAAEAGPLDSAYGPGCLDASMIQRERSDDIRPRSPYPPFASTMTEINSHDDTSEIASLERAFLEYHSQAMMDESQSGSEPSGALAEAPLPVRVNAGCFAPEADLRNIVLRRTNGNRDAWDAAADEVDGVPNTANGLLGGAGLDDELFVRKGEAACDVRRSASWARNPEAETPDATAVTQGASEDDERVPAALPELGREAAEEDAVPAQAEAQGESAPPLDDRADAARADAPAEAASVPLGSGDAPRGEVFVTAVSAPRTPIRRKPSLMLPTVAAGACVAALVSVWLGTHPGPTPPPAHPQPQVQAQTQPPAQPQPQPQPIEAAVVPPPHQEAAARPAARPDAELENLIAQGDERFKTGDIFAARLFYERAAGAGSAHAALMAGATYDPTFLASVGVQGLRGDEGTAMTWYRRARDLGDPEADQFLKHLPPK